MTPLKTIWHNLTTPHPSIATVEQQWQSRLLASLMLVILALIIFAVPVYLIGALPRAIIGIVLVSIILVIVFAFNRRGYYLLAAYLFVGGLFVVVHLSLFDDERITIFFALLLILITGMFLSTRLTVIVLIASISMQLVAGVVTPRTYTLGSEIPLIMTLMGGCVVLLFIYYRYNIERVRRSQLIAVNEQLKRAEVRWRSLVLELPDIVLELDPSGVIRYSNFVSPILSQEEFIGSIVSNYVEPLYQDLSQQIISQVIETRQPSEFEAEATSPNGEKRWYANRLSPVIRDDSVESILVVCRDITARKYADQQNLELTLLRERVDVLQSLISSYSHDMKTPLATIDFSLTILEGIDDPSQQQLELETIRNQSTRLNTLIQNILTLSRLDNLEALERSIIDLRAFLQKLENNLTVTTRQKDVTVHFDLHPELVSVLANELELDRAISNIIENAITYTPDGGNVSIKAYTDGTFDVIEVVDTGIGIAPDDLSKVFEPFYRASGKIKTSGTGLGLAIAKRVVDMHSGELSVESTLGHGSTFRIRLPVAESAPA